MNKNQIKFQSIKEIYEACKNLVTGEMSLKKNESQKDEEYIIWNFDTNTTFYIDKNYFDINSKYLKTHCHPENYDEIYELIMEYNNDFKSNPQLGKKNLKEKSFGFLCYIIFFIVMALIIFVLKN